MKKQFVSLMLVTLMVVSVLGLAGATTAVAQYGWQTMTVNDSQGQVGSSLALDSSGIRTSVIFTEPLVT